MATACAIAFRADRLIFLTDVGGVRGARGALENELDIAQCADLVRSGIATGGMQAKLGAATAAIEGGVKQVAIAAGALPNVVASLIAGGAIGTRVVEKRTAVVS
jgi:acetylglutamate kinase